ncbi:MAG: AAA family ATPase [Gammaproteobacteria bacterium]
MQAPNVDEVEQETATRTDDVELAEALRERYSQVRAEIGKRIIGQASVVELALLTLFAGGNSLIVGVPGLAKTMLVQTIAEVLDLDFSRIQFTPDLMPSDITGTDLIQEDPDTGTRKMIFMQGPVFANIVLADEVNRTPPKTQAALLEAMQERRVTVQGKTYTLDRPFFVFATQNPIELEGTYPLPEAQLDRFMLEIVIEHLPEAEELDVVRATTGVVAGALEKVLSKAELIDFQELVRRVPVADPVARYALALVRASRPGDAASDFVNEWVSYGASVRAAQYLVLGGKARALVNGRVHVDYDDVLALVRPVLRHRILRNFHAESERVTTNDVIEKLVETVPRPSSGL